jgi:general secretion pathway protein M
VTKKSLQLKEKIATLEWMNTVRVKKNNPLEKQKIDNSQLLTLFATQLKDNSTLNAPYELQQTAAGDIELTFESVDFNLFITWLEKINSQYTINIKQFNAEHTSTAGLTHIMILINAQ